MTVTPAYRSGPVVRFPVVRASAATLRLLQDDGTPVPAGASVDHPQRAGAGGARRVRLPDHWPRGTTKARAEWPGHRCSFRFERPERGDPAAGPRQCHLPL